MLDLAGENLRLRELSGTLFGDFLQMSYGCSQSIWLGLQVATNALDWVEPMCHRMSISDLMLKVSQVSYRTQTSMSVYDQIAPLQLCEGVKPQDYNQVF